MSRGHARGGWLLVGLIVVLAGVFVAMATLSFLLVEHRRSVSHAENHTEAFYLAQAGVMQAIYDFRRSASASIVRREYNVDNPSGPAPAAGDDRFSLLGGTQADFFLVNMRANIQFQTSGGSAECGSRNRFLSWPVRNVLNATGGTDLIVAQVRLNWSPNSGEGVIRIDLNGTGSDWTASCSSPWTPSDPLPITLTSPTSSRTIAPLGRWTTNRIWFTADMSGKDWIDVTFIMAVDGSSRTVRFDRATAANRTADVTVKSIGEVQEGPFPFIAWRRVQAEYRICRAVSGTNCDSETEERTQPGALLSYRELAQKSP